MLSYEEFREEIEKELKNYLKEGEELRFNEVRKNNGVKLDGISILKETGVAPTIYLQSFYEIYQDGESLQDIMSKMAETLQQPCSEEINISSLSDYSYIKDRLFVALCSAEQNQELLKEVPHVLKGDFGCVVRVNLGMGNFMVTNNHLKMYGVSAEQLINDAFHNTSQIMPGELKSMNDILEEMTGQNYGGEGVPSMYVLSNKDNYFGASSIMDSVKMDKIRAELHSEVLILPSSVHECILIPYEPGRTEKMQEDLKEFTQMIREVNGGFLSKEEILSDKPYIYDADRKEIVSMKSYVEEQIRLKSECVSAKFKPTEKLIDGLKRVQVFAGEQLSLKEISKMSKQDSTGNVELDEAVKNVAAECKSQQMAKMMEPPIR